MPNTSIHFGYLIRQRRKQFALSQEDLAEMAGVTIKTIYAIENNQGNPTLDVLNNILDVLGLEMRFEIKSMES